MRIAMHWLATISFLFSTIMAHANESPPFPPRDPCQTTTIPAPLRKPKDIIPLGCDRPFVIHGETYSADSPQSQDAQTLRYFMKPVPEADSLLGVYQNNRKTIRSSAYIGTLGLVMFLFSNTISKQFDEASRDSVRNVLKVGGLSLAAGGFFFSFTFLNDNEKLIPRAVETYNKAKPNDPIELQFTTGWRF
jgi:hypothetical protein